MHGNETGNRLVLNHRPNNESGCLFWVSGDTIAVLVDQFALEIDWSRGRRVSGWITVAGVAEACNDFTFVRRYSVKEGETDWSNSVGVDLSTSEWMMFPHLVGRGLMKRETEGNHGDFSIDFTSDVYTFGAGTVDVPWGTQKGDSIRNGLTLGQGMAWWYLENASFEDSLSNVCKSGDTLVLYAFGNDMEMEKYAITVADPAGDMVRVFARHAIDYPDPEDPESLPFAVVGGVPYRVLSGLDNIDTIADIPFATKVDTMLNLLEKAPNATWEIVFAAGVENNEVSLGDLLRVTGGDGTTVKDYYIKTDDYMMSDNVNLGAITWPDKPFAFMEGWKGDTIPGFVNTGVSYKVLLPPGTQAVPALVATTEDPNATITYMRAASLSGGIEERTTTFTVTSESDTTIREVNVLFEVEDPFKQLYIGDPIYSKFFERMYWNVGVTEICNPSQELLDLSNYMIVKTDFTSPGDAITQLNATDSTTWLNRYMKYVPGYKWQTFDNWQVEPGILELDVQVDPYMIAGDVFVLWKNHPDERGDMDEILDKELGEGRGDVLINSDQRDPGGDYSNPWNEPVDPYNTIAYPLFPGSGMPTGGNMFLFKILNDSIRAGTKAAYDPNDFELVDVFGSAADGPWMVGGKEAERETRRFIRLPHSYKGATFLGELLDTDWYTDAHSERSTIPDAERNASLLVIGQHTLEPITEQVSTVSSLVYLVDKGFEGDLDIVGVSNSETVTQFRDNLIPGDPGQVWTVTDAGGTPRGDGDAVVEGDKLQVVSANGDNSTEYIISTVAVSDDATLTAKDGSDLVIEITGETGSVGGFVFGATVKEILENVTVPEFALLNVLDDAGALVPIKRHNNDTVYVDVVANTGYYFEVVAQAGNKIVYQLVPGSESSDAFVLSDVYAITEDPAKVIDLVTEGTAVDGFLANVYPVQGATVKVITVTGQERTMGNVSVDDVLIVTSEDESVTVTYQINFIGELAAYVTSDVFTVSQENLDIEVAENTTVEALVAGLTPAPMATVKVFDVDGNEKSTGTVLETDVVVVISGDGSNELTYSITVIVSVYNDMAEKLQVYPNPATSLLHVRNVPMDSHVRISDVTGRTRIYMEGFATTSGISLDGIQKGLYFLTIEKEGKNLATVKFIKK